MSRYRQRLPQLDGDFFLTDGGLETTLIFHHGMELPYFAAFHLLKNEEGVETLRRYYQSYVEVAVRHKTGFVFESPTWRANPDWGLKLGYDVDTLSDANRLAIGLMLEIRDEHEPSSAPMVISGNLGPRGDGYSAENRMTSGDAKQYHAAQIDTFAGTDADMVTAVTLTHVDEAIGILQAAEEANMPAVISFTVETNGRLPSGDTLADAIRRTDDETAAYASYFMINCAHPTHLSKAFAEHGSWIQRIFGLRANASRRSHAELDDSTDLDAGNPFDLGAEYEQLIRRLPHLTILGGCCGTDLRHLEAIAQACITEDRQQLVL